MAVDRRAALRAWASFEGVGPGARAFLLARLAVVPLAAMDADLRSLRGRVLSVGCGHGVLERYLAAVNPEVTVTGAEVDPGRVAAAARSQHRAPRVTVVGADARRLDLGRFDAAIAVDLLHHVPVGEQAEVAAGLARSLAPGGVCLVKDLDVRPRWKHGWNRLHDRVVNGQAVWCRSPADMAALFEAAGFSVERAQRVERAVSPYAQYLLRLRLGDQPWRMPQS
jgi:SAM-dependent methyltransferase